MGKGEVDVERDEIGELSMNHHDLISTVRFNPNNFFNIF